MKARKNRKIKSASATHIPLVDLQAQYKEIKKEVDGAIRSVIKDSAFIGTGNNAYVKKFEEEFARYIGAAYCIGCGNGTDAIEIALKALGVGPGDEVIVPALTWISTSEAVTAVGATPVFADIDARYYTIDPKKIEEKIRPKTKVIIPVHLYGLPADMDEILRIAKKHRLFVVEDCAQAHGAVYKGKKVGTFGDIAAFSFFPGKNLGAYGDAGGIVTKSLELAEACRLIRNHGQRKKNEHVQEGRNSRLDGLQAAILSAKLPFLPEWIEKRRNIAAEYDRLLKHSVILTPSAPKGMKHAYHLYVIQVPDRDTMQKKLLDAGIEAGVHYPTPLPFIPPYEKGAHKREDFANSLHASERILSLPIYPELPKKEIRRIASTILKIIAS